MSIDLATLTKQAFDPHIGTTFVLRIDGERSLDIVLIETQALPTPPIAKRASFLLRFRSAERDTVPQQTYRLEHPTMGAMDIFLVPAGPDAQGMRYDAVFS